MPIGIDGLPYVTYFKEAGEGYIVDGWRYYASAQDSEIDGLRIEVVTIEDELWGSKPRHEARLVKGSIHQPKHLRVIRLKELSCERLTKALWELRQDYFQKGW